MFVWMMLSDKHKFVVTIS